MNKINLQGVSPEAVAGICMLCVSLVNAVLQMFHIQLLPITDEEISSIVSTVFLITTIVWNTWKNRNITKASQIAQNVTEALKNGEILEEDIREIMHKLDQSRRGDYI